MACRCGYRKNLLEARHSFDHRQAAFFDYNATTPLHPEVLGVMDRVQRNTWYNPSSLHSAGIKAWQISEDAKTNLAKNFGVPADGFSFAPSASAVFADLMRDPLFDRMLLSTTAAEHTSLHKPARIRKLAGRKMLILPVNGSGAVDLDALKKAAGKEKICFIYSAANHETGAVQPVRDIYRIVKNNGGFVILDAVQAAAKMPAAEWSCQTDMFVLSGHKIYGPRGIASVWINPLAGGFAAGWRRRGFRQGTPNIPGIAGLAKAADLHVSEQKQELSRLKVLINEGQEILAAKTEYIVNSPDDAAAGVCNISLPWVNNTAGLLFELDKANIQISRFSACSSGLHYPSRVLLAMGKSRAEAERSLRICLGRNSSRRDFYILADKLSALQKARI